MYYGSTETTLPTGYTANPGFAQPSRVTHFGAAPPPPPINPTYSDNDKFEDPPKYRDPFWIVLFGIHFLGVIAICSIGTRQYVSQDRPGDSTYINIDSKEFRLIAVLGSICMGVAFFVTVTWLSIVKKFAHSVIVITFVTAIVLWFTFGTILLAQGSITGAIIIYFFGLLNALIFWWWRDRIPFASAMLETVADKLHDYPAMLHTAYLSLVIHIVYLSFLFWTISVTQTFGDNTASGLLVFLIFSFYWTTQVIRNVVHVTVSGAVATWYFLSPRMPPNPTLSSFKRSVTTSFGSIVLGSLLVSILETLRALVRWGRSNRDNLLAYCADILLGIIEGLLQYFNLYAFTQVAIYGKPYVRAAKDTWELISTHGVEAIINDNLIVNVLTIGALIGGIVCGVLGAVLGGVWAPDYWGATAAMGFLIGYGMLSVAMEVVQSAVATIFVCFAMDKEALRRNDPYLYQRFMETYYV